MMTLEELQAIKARLEALPDTSQDISPFYWVVDEDDEGSIFLDIPNHRTYFGDMENMDKCCFSIAEFLMQSRRDIPALLAEVERLQADNNQLRIYAEVLKHELEFMKKLEAEIDHLRVLMESDDKQIN